MNGSTADALASMQAYRLLVFDRAVHPEFINVRASRSIQTDHYQLDTWLSNGSHLLLFHHGNGRWLGEAITPDWPDASPCGCIESLTCAGERDHEGTYGGIQYITTVQTEVISDNLYRALLDEMVDFTQNQQALSHRWQDPVARFESGSFVDAQRLKNEVHVQAWHLDATCGLVVRSQTIFELVQRPAGKSNGRY